MKKLLAFILVLFIFSSVPSQAVFAQSKSKNNKVATVAPKFGNTDGITAAQLKNYLEFIASDELEGRDTPSRGLDIAALYIAEHLKSWGIKPAGDNGTYFQKFPLKRSLIDANNTKLSLNNLSFTFGEDFLTTYTNSSVPASNIVYAGHGWVIKSKNINAYQGIDVKDKIVVVAGGFARDLRQRQRSASRDYHGEFRRFGKLER
ncbi:MAG TPA: hypothetical protein PKE69_00370 [Pyrinomonadaceae bacterium]|nr:hypothetical protein [Pyrinomonadaceae bacterium]